MLSLQVPTELQGTYNSAGVANLTASMECEPNTLSMNVAHVNFDPSALCRRFIVDFYLLLKHIASDHYQKVVNEVGSKLTNRKT